MKSYQNYINGEFINNHSEETVEVINPATEEVISRIPKSDEKDVQRAIEAAKASQRDWEKKPSIERAEYLYKIADKVEEKKETFINMLTEENGKTVDASKAEVEITIDYFRYMAGWARRYEGEVLPSDRPNENILVFKKPIGIVGGIVPWNFPMFIFARKVAPAFVTGCPIIIKPSQFTPNTACELTSIIHDIGVPKGVFNLVTGKGSDIGTPLASSPDVQMISLTGSYPAGSKVMEAAAKNITKVNLELGGKAPAIVTKHANVDLAVEKITTSRITNNGQACTNAERVYVHEDVAEDFISKITETFKNTKVGDSLNEDGCDIGPLANKQQIDSVEEMVNNAVKAGAVVKTGGKRVDRDKGFFFEPTVLTDVSQDMNVIQEEIFGPVLPIVIYSDFDKVLEMANDTDYGLSSSIFSDNMHEVMKASNVLRYGETYVNRENFEAVQGFHAGMGQSGIGGADGKHGVNEYLKTHVIYMEYDQDIK